MNPILRYAIAEYFLDLKIKKEEYLKILSKITGDTEKEIELFIQGSNTSFLLESKLMICFRLKLGFDFKDLEHSYTRWENQKALEK